MLFKVDVRDPFLGNTIPLYIHISLRPIVNVSVWTEENIIHNAHPVESSVAEGKGDE